MRSECGDGSAIWFIRKSKNPKGEKYPHNICYRILKHLDKKSRKQEAKHPSIL